ncbi:MAG: hypothetical protein KDA92_01595, partial [Planctomycetales bacterium]|nr:hypothetical protein [Planctomycetales bacterium]
GLYIGGEDKGIFDLTSPKKFPIPNIGEVTVALPTLGVTAGLAPGSDRVLHGENLSRVFELQADFEKLIPFIGPFLHPNFGVLEIDLLSLSGGPTISVYQDQTFTPDPWVRLNFSESVLVDGNLQKSVEFPLGEPISWTPVFSGSDEIIVKPEYMLRNTFSNETGISFGVTATMDAIGINSPIIPGGKLDPLIHVGPVEEQLLRVPLLDPDPWTIPIEDVMGDEITILKDNSDFRHLRFESTSYQGKQNGEDIYDLTFVQDLAGGGTRQLHVVAAGESYYPEEMLLDTNEPPEVFRSTTDIIVTDPDTNESINLGRYIIGADMSQYTAFNLPADGPTVYATDEVGNITATLHVSPLPDLNEVDLDPTTHPILGGPSTTVINSYAQSETVVEEIDVRDGVVATVLARSGDVTPRGDGTFTEFHLAKQFNQPWEQAYVALTDVGDAIIPAVDTQFRDGTTREGVYRTSGTVLRANVVEADSTVGGDKITINRLKMSASRSGAVAFATDDVNTRLFISTADRLTEYLQTGTQLPQNAGTVVSVQDVHSVNRNEQVLVSMVTRDASGSEHLGAYRVAAGQFESLVVAGESLPETGTVESVTAYDMNDAGQALVRARGTADALYRVDGRTLTPLAVGNQTDAAGNQFFSFTASARSINQSGQTTFGGNVLTPNDTRVQPFVAVHDGNANKLIAVQFQTQTEEGHTIGRPSPGTINDAGHVAFFDDQGLYAYADDKLRTIARGNQATPDGTNVFYPGDGSFGNLLTTPLLNNSDHIAFYADFGANDFSYASGGIFLYDGSNVVEIARRGADLAGGTIRDLTLNDLNDDMQLAYTAILEDDREVVVRFEPLLFWKTAGSGIWDDRQNWSLNVEPNAAYDVFIGSDVPVSVTTGAGEHNVRTLAIGAEGGATSALSLSTDSHLSATRGVEILPNGVLAGNGTIDGNVVNNGGIVAPGMSPGRLRVNGNFVQLDDSQLLLEINGSDSGEYDVLEVSGDVTLAGDVYFQISDDFVLTSDLSLDLIHFTGQLDVSAANFFVLGNATNVRIASYQAAGTFGVSVHLGSGVIGDFNDNGVLDAADLDLLAQAQVNGNGTYDLTGDGVADYADRLFWVNDLYGTWMGDANLDGEFNSSDLVVVFAAGKYEQGAVANWNEGDWDGDFDFDSTDLVMAFIDGGYELGRRPALAEVPEPMGLTSILFGLLSWIGFFVRRRV